MQRIFFQLKEVFQRRKSKAKKSKSPKITGGWKVEDFSSWPFIGHTDECGVAYLGTVF